ncbi:MAG: N-acetylmuramoyl-L-alanine amidase [Clostridiales bacterium]|nr:N-acetylmuramoyl-L-alanine amidase [Clostridiales bacterium]
MDFVINKNLTEVNFNSGSVSRIKYIVVHYTANNGDTAYGNTVYFKSENRGASAHYFVDESSVWQCVEDKDIAWHCGTSGKYYHAYCRNSNSLGVELCSEKDSSGNYYFNSETLNTAVKLLKYLIEKYSIGKDNVLRHYDVTHKNCPAPFVENGNNWTAFKDSLFENEEENEVTEKINMTINGKSYSVDRILKDGGNFIRLSDMAQAGFEVGYNADTKEPSLENEVKEIEVLTDGESKSLESVNLKGYNYCKLRDVAQVTGCFTAGYENNTVTITTEQ